MSIEGQGHFFTIYFPGFVCFVLYLAKISGERLQDHWSSGYYMLGGNLGSLLYGDVSVMMKTVHQLGSVTTDHLCCCLRVIGSCKTNSGASRLKHCKPNVVVMTPTH